jgi:hypothetical protein
MATDLERLVVQLEANMRNYERSMNRAVGQANQSARKIETRFERANRSMERGFQRMGQAGVRALGALGVAIGAAQLGRATLQTLEYAQTLESAADRLGFNVEALQEYRFAAEQAGIAQTALDMGLQRFSRRVAEAVNGSGELRDTLRQYNIQLTDSEGRQRDINAILEDYADAIAGASSQQEALRLAFKAFDSEGAALVEILRDGSDGMQRFREQAREAGVVLGEDLVRDGAEAKRTMDELRASIGADFNRAVLENVEGLEALADVLGRIAEFGVAAGAGVGRVIGELTRPDSLEHRIEDLEATESILQRRLENERERMNNALSLSGASDVSEGQSRLAAGIAGEARREIEQLERDLAQTQQALDQLTQMAAQQAGRAAMAPASGAELDAPGARNGAPPSIDQGKPDKASFGVATSTGLSDKADKEAALAEEREAARALAEEQAEAYADALERRRSEFSSEFAHTIAGGWMAAFDGNLADFAAQRLRDALYDRLFTLFNELGRQLFDNMDGKGGLLATGARFLFGGGKAEGGPVRAGTAYRVGERGPETIVPMSNGMVIPNQESMRTGSGASVTLNTNYTIDARGASPDAVAQLRAELPQAFAANNQRLLGQFRAEVPGLVVRARKDGVI